MTDSPSNAESNDLDIIREAIREAESFLESQLTTGLSADQRATSFASVVAAGAAVIGGGGITLILANSELVALGWVAITMSGGLLISMILAALAARPVQFCLPGMHPAHWVADMDAQKPLATSLREMMENYGRDLNHNQKVLKANGRLMWSSIVAACGSLCVGGLVAIGMLIVGVCWTSGLVIRGAMPIPVQPRDVRR